MRSKRGEITVEEVVKTVLGILVFILIIYLLFALAKIVTGNLREEQARNTLDRVVFEAEKLDVGESKELTFESPQGWILIEKGVQLCFCEELSDSKCSGKNVCVDIDSYVSTPCILTGTLGASGGGLFCVYFKNVPVKLVLTKEYGGRVEIDTIYSSSSDLSSSKYKNSLSGLSSDTKFYDFVKLYLASKSDVSKKNLNDYLNSLDFVKAANNEGRYWKLDYDVRGGEQGFVVQNDFGLSSSTWMDYSNLNGVYVGNTFYNLEISFYYTSQAGSQSNEFITNVGYEDVSSVLDYKYAVSDSDCYFTWGFKSVNEYCIVESDVSGGTKRETDYYFNVFSFEPGQNYVLYNRATKKAAWDLTVGVRASLERSSSFYGYPSELFDVGQEPNYVVLNPDKTFSFQKSVAVSATQTPDIVEFKGSGNFEVLSDEECRSGLEQRKKDLGIPDKLCYWQAMTEVYDTKCENLDKAQISDIFEKKAEYRTLNNPDWPSLNTDGDFCVPVIYDCGEWDKLKKPSNIFGSFSGGKMIINPYKKFDKQFVQNILLHEGLHAVQNRIYENTHLAGGENYGGGGLSQYDFVSDGASKLRGLEIKQKILEKANVVRDILYTEINKDGITDEKTEDLFKVVSNMLFAVSSVLEPVVLEKYYSENVKNILQKHNLFDEIVSKTYEEILALNKEAYLLFYEYQVKGYIGSKIEVDPRLSEVQRWWLEKTAPNCEIIYTSEKAKEVLDLFLAETNLPDEYKWSQQDLGLLLYVYMGTEYEDDVYNDLIGRLPGLASNTDLNSDEMYA